MVVAVENWSEFDSQMKYWRVLYSWVNKIDSKELITESKDIQVMIEGWMMVKDETRWLGLGSGKRIDGSRLMGNTWKTLIELW